MGLFCRRPQTACLALVICTFTCGTAAGQSDTQDIRVILGEEILAPAVAEYQLKTYILSHVPALPKPTSAKDWTAEAQRLRQRLLRDIVFHGWPDEWIQSAPSFEDLGVIETGGGYRLRKLRYEIVPGFQSVALLYEPEKLSGKIPAILNVHGHVGLPGKAVEYKQKRCINFAKHGILALSLEWFSFGELRQEGNQHWYGAHLDLVGANALGIFLLEMRRGLDYLYNHPNADRQHLGVTGLSGGGWQTIFLSALDDRVSAAVPVAGYSSLTTKVEALKHGDLGDMEQNGTDLYSVVDYAHLTAMMAPRATLLIHNAEDNCCFRAALVKPLTYEGVKPFFKLYGKEDLFEWHENRDPGTHNYQLNNRETAYRFFSQQFGMPTIEKEIPVGQEIKSYDELVVGLPKDNLTILDLARKFASQITREAIPSEGAGRSAWANSERQKLDSVVRYKPVHLARVWTVANTKHNGVETLSYLFELNNGLCASGVWLKGLAARAKAPATIILNDQGRQAAATDVSEHVNHDEQVLAFDSIFFGNAKKDIPSFSYAQILAGQGDRPLGMEAAQLIEVARWFRERVGAQKVRLETRGLRSQTIGIVATALQPDLFSEIIAHEGMSSLGFLLQAPITFDQAPELFCLDLYKEFDLNSLAAMAAPTRVTSEGRVKQPQ